MASTDLILPASLLSPLPSPAGFISCLSTHQTLFLLHGFALAVPSAWNVFPLDNWLSHSHHLWFTSGVSPEEAFLDHPS